LLSHFTAYSRHLLDALRVVGVENGASRARIADGRAAPADATALAPLGLGAGTAGRSGLGRGGAGSGADSVKGGLDRGGSRVAGRNSSWGRAVLAGEGSAAGSSGNRLALGDGAGDAGDQGRAGDGIVDGLGVGVEEDTGVVGAIQRGAGNASGGVGAGASHAQVEALRVGLGTVGLGAAVKGDDLVAEHVVAGGEAGGDLDEPAVAVGTELVGSPAVIVTTSSNLEEAERILVDTLAGPVAVGEVINDGTDVALGPLGRPDDADLVTGCNGGVALARGSTLVADDVGHAEVVGLDEAVVLVEGSPTDHVGSGARVVEVGGRIVVPVIVAVHNDVADMSVGGHESGTGQRSEEGGSGSHLDDW